jgi:5'-deoxynucleotidase
MPELTLAERLRTGHVKRWQIVRVAREQTLAEHLYLVRVIVLAIAEAAGFTPEETRLAEQWALEHDVPELKTGDLATPFKAMMREAIPHDDPIRRIELGLSDSYAELYAEVKKQDPVRCLVKMADLIEAVHFLSIEGLGTHAKEVQLRLWSALGTLLDKSVERHQGYDWKAVFAVARKLTGA